MDKQTAGDVSANPMRIGPHRRPRNPSIPHQHQQTGDEIRFLPGRHHSARCGSLSKLRLIFNASTTEQGPTPVQKFFKEFSTGKDKKGQLVLLLSFIRIPQPRGTRTFHLTPCLDTTLHSVTQPSTDRLGRGSWMIEENTTHQEVQQVQ